MHREEKCRKFRCYNFEIEYSVRPNSDIYQELLPPEIIVDIPARILNKEVTKADILEAVIDELEQEIQFDTPDEPEFEISAIDFDFDEVK